jgi:hypothetical protein
MHNISAENGENGCIHDEISGLLFASYIFYDMIYSRKILITKEDRIKEGVGYESFNI